ncbi:MAG TPA: metal ABC transporter substrate-binding protein [Casimicrobiaceae bacterium]|nr:metal ABC transporter substrate-binding protein [Casimicrobiaceae bacterium]
MRVGLLALARAAAVVGALTAGAPALAVLRVVATTSDIAALAAAVGGELVSVQTLVPAASDPEAFEPRPGDVDRVRRADLVVRVGLGYDFWLDTLIAKTANARLMRGGEGYLDASVGIPLLEIRGQSVVNEGGHAHGVANPHYWLDPENATIVTAGIAEALVRLLPAERERIVEQRRRFLAALEARLARWTAMLAPYAGAKFIAYHNSWPYFARRFRLDFIAFVEAKPGVAPSPAQLAHLIAEGRKKQVRAIVHEPYELEETSRLLAAKLSVPFVKLATSVGSLPGADDYFALLELNVTALARALGAPGS